jgi:hypothetical protein
VACHQSKHGFGSNSDCANCHYAVAGTVDCNESPDGGDGGDGGGGDGGPLLSDALQSNCFNWPAEEFTADNHAQVQAMAEGSLAVEFTLRDVDGVAYTLSDLLSEKPVLMVFGAYT